jgi:hypothetical protein
MVPCLFLLIVLSNDLECIIILFTHSDSGHRMPSYVQSSTCKKSDTVDIMSKPYMVMDQSDTGITDLNLELCMDICVHSAVWPCASRGLSVISLSMQGVCLPK